MTGRLFIKYLFLFLFFSSAAIFPQVIKNVSVSAGGARLYSQINAQGQLFKSRKVYPGIADSAKVQIQKFLASQGYFNPLISASLQKEENGADYNLIINAEEGELTLIKEINIKGLTPADSAYAADALSYLINAPFIKASLEDAFNSLLANYENRGYPFASIKISSVLFSKESAGQSLASVNLMVDKKNLCTIDRIEVEGNSKTSASLILHSIRFELKSIYSQKEINEIPARLNRLRFFEPVESPLFYYNEKNEGVLKIKIKEKETNSFDGIIGYVPAAQANQSGYFTGFLNIGLRNIFGTGRSLLFRWQTETAQTQELELKYSEPWLFNYPFNIELSLFQRKQDTTYVQRSLEARLDYLASEFISAGVIISTQSTIPSENLVSSSVFNSSYFITGLSLKYDSRDDFYSPSEGIFFGNVYKFERKTISPGRLQVQAPSGSFNLQKFEIDISLFHSFFSRQVTAFSIHARELKGSNLDPGDYYLLGGAYTLRGYREKQFMGNRMLWTNLEYRFLFAPRSFGFLFYDTGYFLRSEDSSRALQELSGFKMGYGAGINIETGLGILSVSFALAPGDSFKDGKIHFGILNEF